MKHFLHRIPFSAVVSGQINNVFLTYSLPKHREHLPLPIPLPAHINSQLWLSILNQAKPILSHIVQQFVYSKIPYL
jgi:hypothetical protein